SCLTLPAQGVAQVLEEPLADLGGLALPATQRREVLVQLALPGVEVGGHHDVHDAELVAAAAGAHVRHADAVDLDHLAVLRPRRQLDDVLAVDRRHGDAVAQHGLRDRHGQLVDHVDAAPLQVGMRLDAEGEVQIAGRSPAWARLALAGDAHLHVLVDAGGHLHLQRLARLDTTLAVAAVAGVLDDAPLALAARACGDVDHLPEDRLHRAAHLPRPVALRAGDRRVPRLGAGAAAVGTGVGSGHLDGALGAVHRVLEGDLQVHAQVRAALRAGARPPAATASPAEEHVEEVEGRL